MDAAASAIACGFVGWLHGHLISPLVGSPVPRTRSLQGVRRSRDRDTVIVATTAGGETLTSQPMPRIQAEMLLALGVLGGHGRVRSTGIVRAAMRRRAQ